jgi:hypothetical protein
MLANGGWDLIGVFKGLIPNYNFVYPVLLNLLSTAVTDTLLQLF